MAIVQLQETHATFLFFAIPWALGETIPCFQSKSINKGGERERSSQLGFMTAEQARMSREDEDEDEDSETSFLMRELRDSMERNHSLEKENQELRQEVARMKVLISSLKAHDNERKSMLWKKLQNSNNSNSADASSQKSYATGKNSEPEKASSRPEIPEVGLEERPHRVPRPPPVPFAAITSSASLKERDGNKVASAPAPAPPPPPMPSNLLGKSKSIHRVPQVVELYRMLTGKDGHMENRTSPTVSPVTTFSKNMIGEIENRSSYLSAIKSDVEARAEFVSSLIKEVESAAYTEISDVEAFVKWLDEELSSLVDERAVLKHFPNWPERKADAMREAACSYRDLKNLESEVSSFQDNPKEPFGQALRRMQAVQDRLERSVSNTEKMRESTSKRYRDMQIPWGWMMDTGLIGQMKTSSLRLAREYMRRVAKEIQSNEYTKEGNAMIQGVKFAFRVHQFAGGFNAETIQAFEELKKVGMCTSNIKTSCNKTQHTIDI